MNKPYYIYDEETFRQNIIDFRNAVKSHYPNYRFGYSYKTNYFRRFCESVNELGEYAEIVSPKEYKYAKSLGVKDEDIIYNGLFLDLDTKINIAMSGGIVNIDNITHFKKFVRYANKHNVKLDVGVRLNFDIGSGHESRFGIDVESSDFKWIMYKENHKNVNIKSIHCHLSQARTLEYFKKRIVNMIHFANILGADIIDIGGNMFGRMDKEFSSQFSMKIPTFEEYAEVIGTEMAKAYPNHEKVLITEGGTPMVSNAMHLVTHIMNVKEIRGQVYIDVNTKREDVGASCIVKNPSYIHIGKDANYVKNAIVSGCTCVEIDNLIRNYNGYANEGDIIVFMNIGAYSNNTTNDFITYGCDKYVSIEKEPKIKALIDEKRKA